ncbi:MAG: hypothetical protein A2234_04350 [Elusimicrobia bacterium RIFOXYA2_FULL_58_8]|nr:MAG: hypothetical protein A2285_09285 [Elusimicrobia bacterium RIFOXYA12_FULL_57_11]OGS13868.1 MAG: hypothetical protein A2234_04350 [Elusimicrobia bacterium RIFOXYA2_FULL_58_8]
MKNAAIFAVILAMAGNAGAAGFRLAEQDAKATGMGNSFVAVADNASAVWYNPAAITGLEGTNIALGTVMVAPSMEHESTNGIKDEISGKLHIPPHLYATRKINDSWSLGLGVNAPFGLSTEWDKTTALTRTVATKSEIAAVNYNLNGAYKATEKISVAAGLSYVMIDATLNSWHPAGREVQIEGDGNAVGYNAAVMYKHNDKLNFGANYRSQAKAKLEGDMKNLTALGSVLPVKTELTLPDMLQFGAAYKYSDKWLFSAEADYTNWTTYRVITFKKQSDGSVVGTPATKNWQSVWAFRLGSEYKYSDTWKFRAGTFYDSNPVKEKYFETRVPDTDRVAVSVGAGYTKGNITVDASYMYLMFMERTVDSATASLDGKYNSVAHLPAITVGYKF